MGYVKCSTLWPQLPVEAAIRPTLGWRPELRPGSSLRVWSGGHPFARLLAPAALLRALLHRWITLYHPLAALRAGATNVRTQSAGKLVTFRTAKHEIGAGPAEVSTVEQQTDMAGGGVLAA